MHRMTRNSERKSRKPIKSALRKDDIHKKFQQQCLSRIRKDREKKIWEMRNKNTSAMDVYDEEMTDESLDFKKILKEEWDKFKLTYEYYGCLTEEEIEEIEMDMKNESDLVDREYMELLSYENQMLENAIESFQNEALCPVCESGILFEDCQMGIIKCNKCSLEMFNKYNLESLKTRINELQAIHRNNCNSNLVFSFQPEIGLYGICMNCCGMEVV
ncbi:hypothetical protein BCR36DRAFT_583210 [Piromyces finnis]|uniref:RPA-interacting protein C-terminal domain-containing protein n=1 Tax=Piromyces finnis TaxID=1754191 RepID=A0A1Y1VAU2_9FUNG|nr:hypothetical protein BCR36DRAFT_583210 [Piromyces finnis]|eukprot:ORX50627.1 hypothetical protein BCR36DRAFT_583210 [Piromyces finnis]